MEGKRIYLPFFNFFFISLRLLLESVAETKVGVNIYGVGMTALPCFPVSIPFTWSLDLAVLNHLLQHPASSSGSYSLIQADKVKISTRSEKAILTTRGKPACGPSKTKNIPIPDPQNVPSSCLISPPEEAKGGISAYLVAMV